MPTTAPLTSTLALDESVAVVLATLRNAIAFNLTLEHLDDDVEKEGIIMSKYSTVSPIWLQLRMVDTTRIFELRSENERAIVVGSLVRADFCVNEPGIAPVHFHFERDGYLVYLVPAYGAEVRVDGRRVTGPYAIRDHALVEFASHRMRVLVLEHAPRSSPGETNGGADDTTPEDPGEYDDRTTIAVPPYAPASHPCHGSWAEDQVVYPILLEHVLAPRGAKPTPGASRPEPEACSPPGASAPRVDRRVEDTRCTDAASNDRVPSTRFVEHAENSEARRAARALVVLGVALVALAALALVFVIRRASPASVHTALPASTTPSSANSLKGPPGEDWPISPVSTEQGVEDSAPR